MIVYTDLDIDFVRQKFVKINAKAGDSNTRFIRITCYNDGVKSPLDSIASDVYLRYKKSDGTNVFVKGDINEYGQAEVEIVKQMLTAYGLCYADLLVIDKESPIIRDGGKIDILSASVVSSMLFCINVQSEAFSDDVLESFDDYSDLLAIIEAAKLNSKKWDDWFTLAETSATKAEDAAGNAEVCRQEAEASMISANTSETNAAQSEANAAISESRALNAANSASKSASDADLSYQKTIELQNDAEAWAIGTINKQPVPISHRAYQNSSKYWAQLAELKVAPKLHGAEINYILEASKWVGNEYSLEDEVYYTDEETGETYTYSFDKFVITMQPDEDATLDEIKAFGNALLTSKDNENILVANGNVPTMNIHVMLYIIDKATLN